MLRIFGILSGLFPLLGALPYLRDTLDAKTKPHQASFLIWTLLGAIVFFSQLADGAKWSLIVPAEDTIGTLIVFILAVRGGGRMSFNRRDIIAIGLCALGLLLWYFTKRPVVALGITIAVDVIATSLTVHKTYLDPDSETFSAWFFSAIGGLFAALAVGKWSLALLLYPIYLVIGNGAVASAIALKGKVSFRLN
jgi:hypothetical protein